MTSAQDETSTTTSPLSEPAAGEQAPTDLISSVAHQIAHEAGLTWSPDIEDLVILSYVGLLDSPPPEPPNQERLLHRSRKHLIVWAWEQGRESQPLPISGTRHPT